MYAVRWCPREDLLRPTPASAIPAPPPKPGAVEQAANGVSGLAYDFASQTGLASQTGSAQVAR